VFVSGEVVTGPGSAIAAVASGHRAALAIHLYLQGETSRGQTSLCRKRKDSPDASFGPRKDQPGASYKNQTSRSGSPLRHYDHFEIGYSEKEALEEAGRCRGCGGGAVVDTKKCMACLTCQRICPYGAPVVTSVSEIRPEYCQACGSARLNVREKLSHGQL